MTDNGVSSVQQWMLMSCNNSVPIEYISTSAWRETSRCLFALPFLSLCGVWVERLKQDRSNWDFSVVFNHVLTEQSPALHINLPSLFSWPFLTSRSSTPPYPTLDPSLPPRDELYNKLNEFFGKAQYFHWEHQLLLSFEWKDGEAKMGRHVTGENEGAMQR